METRANHVLIGLFTLIVIFGAFGFTLWLAKSEIDREIKQFEVIFDGDVSGLSVAGDVRYNGIVVGQVQDIYLMPKNPRLVGVVIEVAADTPVKQDTVASLEYQGVTGVAFIQLKGGNAGSPNLVSTPEKLARIESEKSSLQELFAGAPELINRAIILIDEVTKLVGNENRESITTILNNVETLSSTIAANQGEIDQTMENVARMSEELADASGTLTDLSLTANTLMKTADGVMQDDVKKLLGQINDTAATADRLAQRVEGLMDKHKEAIDNFAGQGLGQFGSFVVEARSLVASLERVSQRMESEGARFLLGGSRGSEFQAQ